MTKPAEIKLRWDRIEAWQQQGAKLSDAARGLMRRARKAGDAAPATEAPVAEAQA